MKVIELHAENVKKIKAVDITPKADFIPVTGKNGSGKSSILDCIWWALGGKDAIQKKPIREGELSAKISLNLGDITVHRKFTEKGTALIVENAEGQRYTSPQSILDDLVGTLSVDPLEFSRMKSKDKFEMLRQVANIDLDFEGLADLDEKDYEERRNTNRDLKAKEAQLEGVKLVAEAPDQPIDTAALMQDLDSIQSHNSNVQSDVLKKERYEHEIAEHMRVISELETKLKQEKFELESMKKLYSAIKVEELKDESQIREKLAGADRLNEGCRQNQKRKELIVDIRRLRETADSYTKEMEARQKQRDDALKAANLPVEGLSFSGEEILLNGVPFDQASSAEQLRASVGVAMAANPKLRILRIKDGSLLDDEGMNVLKSITDEHDYQVWVECVDTSGKVGLYMEDGAIAANNLKA